MSWSPPPGRVPPGTRRLALPQAALFVNEAGGEGPPFLFVAGACHGAWCWAEWLALLARAGIPAAALDHRGHGTMEGQGETAGGFGPGTRIADYAADARDAAMALGGRVILVGHSLGGLTAGLAATMLPDLAGLVLLAPSPPGNMPGGQAMPPVPTGALLPLPSEQDIAGRWLGGETPPWLPAYRAALSPESPAAMNERYGLTVGVDAARIRCPALVIEAGRDDPIRHPPGQDEAVARHYGAEYRMLPDMPHCFMMAHWAEAGLAPLLAWRARIAAPRPAAAR